MNNFNKHDLICSSCIEKADLQGKYYSELHKFIGHWGTSFRDILPLAMNGCVVCKSKSKNMRVCQVKNLTLKEDE